MIPASRQSTATIMPVVMAVSMLEICSFEDVCGIHCWVVRYCKTCNEGNRGASNLWTDSPSWQRGLPGRLVVFYIHGFFLCFLTSLPFSLKGSLFQYKFNATVDAFYYKQLAYDAVAISDKDFFFGVDQLSSFFQLSGVPGVSSNLDVSGEPRLLPYVFPYKIFTVGGVTVGYAPLWFINFLHLFFHIHTFPIT